MGSGTVMLTVKIEMNLRRTPLKQIKYLAMWGQGEGKVRMTDGWRVERWQNIERWEQVG